MIDGINTYDKRYLWEGVYILSIPKANDNESKINTRLMENTIIVSLDKEYNILILRQRKNRWC